MFVRSLARASTSFRALMGVALALLAATTQAAPVFTGNPISALFDGARVTVNLKDQNVLIGGPPVNVSVGTIFINGQAQLPPPAVNVVQALQFGVCLTIEDLGFDPQRDTSVAVQLTAGNARQQTVTAIVPILLQPGPTVDIADLQQQFRCNDPNSQPTANAGPDRTVGATTVVLDGSGSSDPDPGAVLTYQWFEDGEFSLGQPSTSPTLSVALPLGTHNITLQIIDDSNDIETGSDIDDVTITVTAAVPPIADAGPNRSIADTDGQPGERVTLDGSASRDPDGTIATYEWIRLIDADTFQSLGNGATLSVTLPDGTNDIRLNVTDNDGNRSTDQVGITVAAAPANAAPTANAGADRNIADSDGQPGESVTLDGSASTDTDGTITSFEWRRVTGSESSESLGTGRTLTVTLPDGENDIFLIVTDNGGNTSVDGVLITVATPPPETVLSDIPGLTPNQSRMANKLDSMCDALAAIANSEGALTADQSDLLTKCNGIRIRTATNQAAQQIEAIEELIPDDFSVARTQTLLFANTQYASIMDRLMALRGGAKGLSLAGLNIIVDGKMVPLAQIEDMVKQFFGGGASADEPGGLLSDKWGLWVRGNVSFGEKDASAASPAFDADQWAFVGGLDYRLSDKAVLGAALSYGSSSVDFDLDDGTLDTDSYSLSLYGSAYAAKNFYFDGIVNFSNSSYDAFRNITYVDGIGLVDADASGDTDGTTLSGGLSAGYDFLLGGLTISPNLGFFYIDTTIDGFTETGAAGLNLIYDEQKFKSMTGNAGLRLTYAWNLSWGVLLPHLRVDYVKEFEDDVDVFGVRFANDPNAASTPPVLVATDNPDQSYWRLAGGFSAQFKHGISGYIEYQRLESFEFISFQDVSIGLRFQRSF
jgi:outer membrane autotransporter protein